jgi:hypothetical protein
VQRILLSDDELWRAIADNTDALSALVDAQGEFESDVGAPNDAHGRTIRMKIDAFERQYRDYAAELRRRYP